MEDDHAFPNIFPSNISQCQTCRLASGTPRDLYPFPFDGTDFGRCELAQTVRSHQDGVTCVDYTGLHYTGDYGANKRYGKRIVDMELERRRAVVVPVVGQYVEEGADQVKIVSGDIRYLEDGAYSTRHELSRSVDALLLIADEDGYFPRARRFENFGELRYGLFQNLRRTDVDFGYADHDWHVQRESNAEVLFAHADKTVIRRNHQQTVVGLAR